MNDENELLEPLATEAGQEAIVRAIRDISSLEYAVRAEQAASTASAKAGEASQSALEASEAEDNAKDWATKTDGYVEQETITVPPEQEGEEPTTETINLYSARYYAALAQDTYNNMQFDSVPTENSTNMVNSGTVYSALDLKADKSNTYTKSEVDTAIGNVQSFLIFDNLPTQNSNNLVKSGGIYTALDEKADKSMTYTKTETDAQISTAVSNLVNSAPSTLDTLEELADALGDDPNFATTIATQLGLKADKSTTYTKTEVDTALSAKADQSTTYTKTEVDTALSNVQSILTFDNVPTANSDNPVKSSGIKTALDGKQDTLTFDSTPTVNSTNPVTSGGIYTALQNVNIDIDDEITEDSDNPVTSAAIYEALQNFTPSGGGGGAGNASGVTREELWSGTWTSGSITLSNPISNYDFIEFVYYSTGGGRTQNYSRFVSSQDLLKYTSEVSHTSVYGYGNYNYDFYVQAPDILIRNSYNMNYYAISGVYGIKFSKNLSEQMYSNVLYENSSGFNTGALTLSDNWEEYDFVEFYQGDTSDGDKYIHSHLFSKQDLQTAYENYQLSNGKGLITFGYNSRWQVFFVSGNNTFYCSNQSGVRTYKIVGYKMAKGGYSGIVSDARMTVKSGRYITTSQINNHSFDTINITFDSPMPDANYEVFLQSGTGYSGTLKAIMLVPNASKTANGFQVNIYAEGGNVSADFDFDWIAIRPNSYTREGMVEDVLFSNASGVNSGTINLSGNISDYDLIQIFTTSNDTVEGVHYQYDDCYLLTAKEMLYTNQTDMRIHYRGLGNYYIVYNVQDDNTINVKQSGNVYIIKITGIKFGRYVSGVAVDTTVTQNSNAVVTSGAVYDALQNYTPSGGGSSITVDSTITQGGTNPVEGGAIYTALGDKADQSTTYTKTEVDTALASKGDVTTNTDQNITGTKTFVGSKKVGFKQSTSNDKLGFTLYGNTGTERGYLEFNPTNTIDGVAGLMTLGNYATNAGALTHVGFRRYSNISGANGAYNLLTPLIADAKTPFSLTTSYTNFYLPLGFTDGTTTVKTAKSGLVDLSPLLASLEARIAALEGN